MELPPLMKLTRNDAYALTLSCMLGVLVGCVIRDSIWAVYASLLVADHLFLGWLIFLRDVEVERPLPLYAIVLIHLLFAVLVIALVAGRQHIPRFGLLPLPLAAIGLSILSSAAGREKTDQAPGRLRGARRSLTASHSMESVAAGAKAASHADRAGVQSPAGSSRRPGKTEMPPYAANGHSRHSEPAEAIADEAISAAFPGAQPNGSVPPAQPAILPPAPAAAGVVERPQPGNHRDKPRITEVVPDGHAATEISQLPPVYLRDNSIAEGIRQKPPEHLARIYPILAASAEDNEEWLKHRGSQNPTHRKPGLSVKEEYEQWLLERTIARAAKDSPNGNPTPKIH